MEPHNLWPAQERKKRPHVGKEGTVGAMSVADAARALRIAFLVRIRSKA